MSNAGLTLPWAPLGAGFPIGPIATFGEVLAIGSILIESDPPQITVAPYGPFEQLAFELAQASADKQDSMTGPKMREQMRASECLRTGLLELGWKTYTTR